MLTRCRAPSVATTCTRCQVRPAPSPARAIAAPAAAPALSRSPRQSVAQGAPAATPADAARRWARRRTGRPADAAPPTRAGSAGSRQYGLPPRQHRLPGEPGRRRPRSARPARSGPRRTWSWHPRLCSQCLPQLVQPRTMRVLTVPSGRLSRATASACVSPAKNVVSIAWRSAGVSTASAARSNSPCSRSSSTSRGSGAASACCC